MRTITSDLPFTAYAVLYPRVLPAWITLAIIVLLIFLWTNPSGGLVVLVLTFLWVVLLFVGIFVCVIIRKYVSTCRKVNCDNELDVLARHGPPADGQGCESEDARAQLTRRRAGPRAPLVPQDGGKCA